MRNIFKENIILVSILLFTGIGATFETKDIVSIIISLTTILTIFLYKYIQLKKDA